MEDCCILISNTEDEIKYFYDTSMSEPEKGNSMNIDEKHFFQQAALRICGTLEIEQALMKCFQYLQNFIPMDEIALNRYDPALFAIRLVASATADQGKKLNQIVPLPENLRDFIEKKQSEKQHVKIINRLDMDPVGRFMSKFLKNGISSVLALPLKIENVPLGIITLNALDKDRFTEDHARLLSLLHDPFAIAASNTLKHEEVLRLTDLLNDDNRYFKQELRYLTGDKIIGADFGLKNVMEMVRQAAPRETPVLLLGETGVGKELIANAIHFSSPRKEAPFIKVNCGAIPDALLDSELFGHEKGAFTGAIAQKRGRFERAHGGTIFLDEIGELPMQAQVRLLRVIQQKEIERVGGSETIEVDIRIIAATHRNLESMVAAQTFREDLWYRLSVFPILIPPLRQRKTDIPALLEHFLKRKSMELKLQTIPPLAPGAIEQLSAYHWKGNVRELENVVERALIQYKSGPLRFDPFIFPSEDEPSVTSGPDDGVLKLDEVISRHIEETLRKTNGKINGPGGAAELLGIHPSTLRNRMNKLKIPYGRKKNES